MAIPDAAAAKAGAAAFTLPYVEFSHALLRAHLDAHAMAEANRALAAAMRDILHRQMTLALELAESTLQSAAGHPPRTAPAESAYDKAAAAVRELGEAVIEAQLSALRTLQRQAAADVVAKPGRPPGGFSRSGDNATSALSPGG